MIRYRPEIDGLRAVAVLPVILFHAGFELFSGGYVGVDVFFVISGYLITSIIQTEIQEGKFSLLRFYDRRIRRILPALFLVSVACVPFAWFWMMPNEFQRFAQSLVAVNFFASNFLFLRESGYFAAASELKPLLHTWSLAVEEQFYVVFPLFLLLLRRYSQRTLMIALVVLTILSLGLAEWASRSYPAASFFLLPSRCWELGVGAILAIGANSIRPQKEVVAQLGSLLGLGMVLVAFMTYDKSVRVPGVWGVLPVLGTALIIVYGTSATLVGRFLGWRPVAGIGLISYGAYLWHQPLFAFARIRFWDGVSPSGYLGLSVLALGLAYLSWRFVERPCRNPSLFSARTVCSGALSVSCALIAFGVIVHVYSGMPFRHDDTKLALTLEQGMRANRGLGAACSKGFNLSPDCRTSDTPEIIVWGDSYAMHIVDGILASNPNSEIVQMTKSHCGPFLDVAPVTLPAYNEKQAKACLDFNKKVQNYISESSSLKYAVLSSPFTQYLSDDAQVYYDGKTISPKPDLIVERFKATLDWLIRNDVKPIVFEAPPRNRRNTGLCLARNAWFGSDRRQCSIEFSDYNALTPQVLTFLEEIDESYAVVRMKDFLCRGQDCIGEEEGVFFYRDAGHLSRQGSRYIGKKMNFYKLITYD